MKVAWIWLREFLATPLTPAQLADRLTMAGLACDGIDGEGDAAILELAATTNRPDWLSHYGVAREAAAAGAGELTTPAPPRIRETPAPAPLRVVIDAPEACGLYVARVFDKVSVRPSGAAVAARLLALGHHGVNHVADWTNYTLLEFGHPTHAFDLDRLRGAELRVRFARAGERLVTLDGIERKLDPADLVIADAERPVALAGIMGGLESAITASTTRVALESAWFAPAAVRRTAKRHAIRTEASFRFERGADPAAARLAAEWIAARLQSDGAAVIGETIEAAGQLPEPRRLVLRPATLRRILGSDIPAADVKSLLERIGFRAAGADAWGVPTWRPDVAQEADLVEEVARLYGYDKFEPTLPGFTGWSQPNPRHALRDRIREQLRNHGYAEAMSLSFAAESECRAFAPDAVPVRVQNPLSDEAAILRTSALPGLLHLLRNNRHRGLESPRLFEIGKLYTVEAGSPRERAVLAIGAAGDTGDFHTLKGEVEALLDAFDLPKREYRPAGSPGLHPGHSATVSAGDLQIGRLGRLDAATAAAWKLPESTVVAELELEPLYAAGARPVAFQPPSRYPSSQRDFSFLFADNVTWDAIEAALAAGVAHLVEIGPVEIFRDPDKLGPGNYSLLLRARFQCDDRTLRDDEVQSAADTIAARLRALGGTQR